VPSTREPKNFTGVTSSDAEGPSTQAKIEYFGHLSGRLQQMTISAQQFVYFSGLIAAAIVSAGLVANRSLVVVLGPYALTFVLTYQVQLYTDVECLTTLKEHLETDLNKNLKTRLYLENVALSISYRNRWSVKLLQIIYLILMVGVFVQSVRTSYHHQVRWAASWMRYVHLRAINLHYLNIAGVVICLLLLGFAVSELFGARTRTLRSITEATFSTSP
jgi:hypothetical protein